MQRKDRNYNFVESNIYPMNRQQIGEIIKIARNKLKWSQMDLAAEAGVKQPTVSAAENGKDIVGLDALNKILLAVEETVCLTIPTTGDKSHQEQ